MTAPHIAARRTKIVATIGPASRDPERMAALAEAGVDWFRINGSHGSAAEHEVTLRHARSAARATGRAIGVLLDLPGPKVRTGKFVSPPVTLVAGANVALSADDALGDAQHIRGVNPEVIEAAQVGDAVYLVDGTIRLEVVEREPGLLYAIVRMGGTVGDRSGINVPGTTLPVHALTDTDRELLKWAVMMGVDAIACSFIRNARELREIRAVANSHRPGARLVAKIEMREAMYDLDALATEADGLMVARGDLGVELPFADVPLAQKRICRVAQLLGKPCMVATQMLQSMVHNSRPTRAEASDAVNAIYDGADSLMLAQETAIGEYPVEAVRALSDLAMAAESQPDYLPHAAVDMRDHVASNAQIALAWAAVSLAEEIDARAIVVGTRSGASAIALSRHRPRMPIVALSGDTRTAGWLAATWGVTPIVSDIPMRLGALSAWAWQGLPAMAAGLGSGPIVVVVGGSDRLPGAITALTD